MPDPKRIHDLDQAFAETGEHAGHVMAFYKTVLAEMLPIHTPMIAVEEAMKLTQSWVGAMIYATVNKPPQKEGE